MGMMFFVPGYWYAAGILMVIHGGLGFFEIGLNGVGVRIFTVNSALKLNLLHFFFGLGSIGGPWFSGLIAQGRGNGCRYLYPGGIVIVLLPALLPIPRPLPCSPPNYPPRRH